MRKSVKRKLDECYEHIKPYLNSAECCNTLHDMCEMCEMYCGLENHDYEKCRNKSCFINYLGYEYMSWADSWEVG